MYSGSDYEHRYPNGREDYDEISYERELNKANLDGKRSKRRRYFPSNRPQAFIVNAVTGVPYPYFVGSKEQSLLYKIVDATGSCDGEGYVIKSRNDLPNHNTNHLFFDSPEQCMSHMRLSLNPEDVKRWHDRRQDDEEFEQ